MKKGRRGVSNHHWEEALGSPFLHTIRSTPSVPVRCPRRTLGTVPVYSNHPFDCGLFLSRAKIIHSGVPIDAAHEREKLNLLTKLLV